MLRVLISLLKYYLRTLFKSILLGKTRYLLAVFLPSIVCDANEYFTVTSLVVNCITVIFPISF